MNEEEAIDVLARDVLWAALEDGWSMLAVPYLHGLGAPPNRPLGNRWHQSVTDQYRKRAGEQPSREEVDAALAQLA